MEILRYCRISEVSLCAILKKEDKLYWKDKRAPVKIYMHEEQIKREIHMRLATGQNKSAIITCLFNINSENFWPLKIIH